MCDCCLHEAAGAEVEHLEGGDGVDGVDQQPAAPGVRGHRDHRALLLARPVNSVLPSEAPPGPEEIFGWTENHLQAK